MPMRIYHFCDSLVSLCGKLGAISIAGSVLIIVGQIACNLINAASFHLWRAEWNFQIPSYYLLAGYGLSFSTFLCLGWGIRKSTHIRIAFCEKLFVGRQNAIYWFILYICGFALAMILCLSLGKIVIESIGWETRSFGLLNIPEWIPQSVDFAGTCALALATALGIVDSWRELTNLKNSDNRSNEANRPL